MTDRPGRRALRTELNLLYACQPPRRIRRRYYAELAVNSDYLTNDTKNAAVRSVRVRSVLGHLTRCSRGDQPPAACDTMDGRLTRSPKTPQFLLLIRRVRISCRLYGETGRGWAERASNHQPDRIVRPSVVVNGFRQRWELAR